MSKALRVQVTPIYGWGWVAGDARRDVPEPFAVAVDHVATKNWSGVALGNDHEFKGRRVNLSQRHVEWDGYVNIEVTPQNPSQARSLGFGKIDLPLEIENA